MTFDKWVDGVNSGVRSRLGSAVRTEELSWDSAMWTSAAGTAVASVSPDDASRARVVFDGGDNVPVNMDEGAASDRITDLIVARLAVPR